MTAEVFILEFLYLTSMLLTSSSNEFIMFGIQPYYSINRNLVDVQCVLTKFKKTEHKWLDCPTDHCMSKLI